METAGNMSAQAAQISVVPELSVRRGRQAIEFYKAAFSALEIYRVGGTEEDEEVVAQLSVGNASFWGFRRVTTEQELQPRIVAQVEEEHGWLLGRIEDPFGTSLGGRGAAGRMATLTREPRGRPLAKTT
jgi:PhnB protein